MQAPNHEIRPENATTEPLAFDGAESFWDPALLLLLLETLASERRLH
jgi:hypothetical protein